MFKDVAEIKAEIEKQLNELGITEEYSASEEEREESEKQEESAVVSAIEATREELASISRSVVSLLEKELPETEVNIDLSPVIDSLKKIEKTIDKYKPQEIRDYSDLLKQILAASGKNEKVDLSPVVDALERLANKKETVFEIPKELITKDNRIRVEVDRAGSTGHRSTLSSTESAKLLTLATESKQDAIVAAIENITIPAPAGGATEAKQDTIITALGDITTPADTQPVSAASLPLPTGASTSVNQETLISLIQTLQETNHRLSFLAGMANGGAVALRTIPIASVSTAVTGTVTATVASTSITNFGTGIPASEMAHDINNQTAVLANINNVTA